MGSVPQLRVVIGDRVLDTGLHTTTPDANDVQRYLAEMADAGMTHCVLEATSHGLAQHRVTGCEFDIAVVTNITHEHLDVHGSLEAYRAAKGVVFISLAAATDKGLRKAAILNNDDSSNVYLREWIERSGQRDRPAESITYAIRESAQWNAFDIDYRPDAIHFTALGPGGPIDIVTPLVGEFNVSNCLAAIAATVDGGRRSASRPIGDRSPQGYSRPKKNMRLFSIVSAFAGKRPPANIGTSPKGSPAPKMWRICSLPSGETLKTLTRPEITT